MSGTTCKRNRPTMAETPTQVIADSDHHNSKCYMWVHRSGEFYTRRPIVIYEYQKGRDHQKPLDFYKDYKGILVTDSLQQYHLVDKKLADVTNANCWAHAPLSQRISRYLVIVMTSFECIYTFWCMITF